MTKVLIAVDDTEHSLRAAEAAHTVFGDHADYLIINVTQKELPGWGGNEPMRYGVAYPAVVPGVAAPGPFPLIISAGDPMGDVDHPNPVEHAEQVATNIAAAAHLPSATAIGDTGDPTPGILHAADAHDVDVVVVGSSSAGWFSRLVSRPIADGVVRKAQRPVMVVP
jgi:nucleotide-binding universal stress UspA family protein